MAFIVCHRDGVRAKAQTCLSRFVGSQMRVDAVNVYRVMRVAGRVESVVGLVERARSMELAGDRKLSGCRMALYMCCHSTNC